MTEIQLHRAPPIQETHPWAHSAEQPVGPGPERRALEDEIWRGVRQQLSPMDIERMIQVYNNEMDNEWDKIPAQATADELFKALRESGRESILIWLQALLCHVSHELFDLVADLAKSRWPRLKIPHYSRVDPRGARPDTPNGYRPIAMYVNLKWPRLVWEMGRLKATIAEAFEIHPGCISIAQLFHTDSAWVTILIPEQAIKDQDEQAFIQRLKTFPEIKDAKFGDPPLEALEQAWKEMAAGPVDVAASSSLEKIGQTQQLLRTLDLICELPTSDVAEKETGKRKVEADTTGETSEEVKQEAKEIKKFKTNQQWRDLTKEDLLEHMKTNPSIGEDALILKRALIEVKNMPALTLSALRLLGMSQNPARNFLAQLEKLAVFESEITTKVLNDGLLGHLEFPLLCMKIIDTPEFQRLRDIKQLGSAFLVYPGAMHSRFQHSLGVAHLARKVVKALQKHQPSLDITEEDVLCVTIAGLCRDLGKGPHSHLFTKFMHTLHTQKHASGGKGKGGKKKKQAQTEKKWNPASTSLKMFDYLIEKNNAEIKKEMHRMGLSDTDIEFIREQIRGNTMDPQDYKGREPEKHFLYEIVAMRRNGIDVVRWDDIARDAAMLGLPVVFDHRRFVKHVRVVSTDDGMHICARDKDADDHYKMFQARHMLGQRAYFHKVNQAVEAMLEDVLLHVEKSDMRFRGKSTTTLKLSECVDDPVAFSNLNDGIFHFVEMSTEKSLEKAREILLHIKERRLYKMMVETLPHKQSQDYPIEFDLNRPNGVVVKKMYLDYGWKDQDPLEKMWFYKKEDPTQAVKIGREKVSTILPEKFAECITRLYCDPSDADTQKKAVEDFEAWCTRYSLAKEKTSS